MPFNSFEDYPMSWRPRLDKNTRGLSRALARQLSEDIRSGVLRPGTKLPPQRELADFLDVNVSTVSKAFKLCALQGLLSATVGSGTFVSYDALCSGNLLLEPGKAPVIDMGPTAPEPSANELLRRRTREMLSSPEAGRLFSYRAPGADEWQRDAAAALMADCGHQTSRERVLFAGGGQNALTAVLAAMFRRGDKIAVDDHTYPGIKTAAAMLGIQLVPVAGQPDGMDTQMLKALCGAEKIQGVYLIPACHNPTTVRLSGEKREQIAEIVRESGCRLIEDGTYQILEEGGRSISDLVPEQSAFIVSLSKGIAPGLRLAYLSVPEAWKEAAADALYSLNVATAPLMSELAARLIVSGEYREILELHRRRTRERNKIVDRYFSKDVCRGGDRDIFRWLRLPSEATGTEFERRARARGVRVFGAERFAVGNTAPQRAVRLSICAPATPEEMEAGLQTLASLL